ncbi:MAG TPA: YifB family Mg chelatase-like AAA ATPase [Sporichthyaceae bacterium]|nr:YifB family Mg chelatase-like AAA ATPase [Sporichthyaceae bacterium]
MGLARGWAVALAGVTGRIVAVEADVGDGLPGFGLIGLPDTALSEARVRVQAAVANSAEQWPKRKVTVSLSPADLHKRGAGFDLVLALVVLAAADVVPAAALADTAVLGELGLNGAVHGLRGVLPAVAAAARSGLRRAIVPAVNLAEAALVEDIEVIGVATLREALAVLRGDLDAGSTAVPNLWALSASPALVPDLRDIRGQHEARWALEVAAAGGHSLFMHGTPGTGKTMLAERLPGLLPPLSAAAALEVTEIHSVAGALPADVPLITVPPFRAPHHSATQAAIVGGGSGEPRPGACSLAHHGILFLDEATEFRGGVLDALREPLESGHVVIARAGVTARFPARFMLVLAANPCSCGRSGSAPRTASCTCTSVMRRRYLGRLSRPLLDRIDLQVTVDRPSSAQLLDGPEGESTALVAQRVLAARGRAGQRLVGTPWTVNAQVPARLLRTSMRVEPAATRVVQRALEQGTLSARGLDRVFRIAWTLADLAARDRPGVDEVGGALALRTGAGWGWAA